MPSRPRTSQARRRAGRASAAPSGSRAWESSACRARDPSTGFAADRREDRDLVALCVDPVRAILFDPSELPQLRVLALNCLTRNWLTIEDAMRLKRLTRRESLGMRALFADFLNNVF